MIAESNNSFRHIVLFDCDLWN